MSKGKKRNIWPQWRTPASLTKRTTPNEPNVKSWDRVESSEWTHLERLPLHSLLSWLVDGPTTSGRRCSLFPKILQRSTFCL